MEICYNEIKESISEVEKMAKSVKKQTAVATKKAAKAQVSLEERVETLERNMLILVLCVAGLIGFVLVYTMMDDETLWWKNNSQPSEQGVIIIDEEN